MQGQNHQTSNAPDDMAGIIPPVLRSGAGALNRALFTRTFDLAAATVNDTKAIAHYRLSLLKNNELLRLDRLSSIVPNPDKDVASKGGKCLILSPGIKAEGECLVCCFPTFERGCLTQDRAGNMGKRSERRRTEERSWCHTVQARTGL